MTRTISQTPAEAYIAVNPDEALPSGDARYVALDAVRGARNIAEWLRDLITIRESGSGVEASRDYARFLVLDIGVAVKPPNSTVSRTC